MKIALIQQRATPDRGENLERALDGIRRAAESGAELVAFAELAFEPFHPQRPGTPDASALAEPIPGPTTDTLGAIAAELGVVLVANLFERDGDLTFDTSPVLDADGRLLGRTRMTHITDYPCFHERDYYSPGDTGAVVYDTAVGRVGVAICYDRHFPEYMRALALAGADLVVIPQAGAVDEWPEGVYEAEVQAAAFQNGYFVALCNRVGEEPCLTFAGESFVCGPDGEVLARAPRDEESILLASLELDRLDSCSARRLFLHDRRPELYVEWFRLGGEPKSTERVPYRHLLATLAYRFQRAVQGAPAEFGDLRAPEEVRTPREIIQHMSRVIRHASRTFDPDLDLELPLLSWEAEVSRFYDQLEALDHRLASGRSPASCSLETLLQGPIADALTHVGQIALLRRLAGSSIAAENFMKAPIRSGRVGRDAFSTEEPA